MENFFKRTTKPANSNNADVEMKDAGHLMAAATEKPKYVPWIEK
jgi:hypothetical protein